MYVQGALWLALIECSRWELLLLLLVPYPSATLRFMNGGARGTWGGESEEINM